jgi:hypothetical protein
MTALVLLCCVAVLIPWTLYLDQSLPSMVGGRHVRAFWVGFDLLLIGGLAGTALLTLMGRMLAVGTAAATALLLILDAVLDIAWAQPGWHLAMALVRAMFIELPTVGLLFYVCLLARAGTGR